MVLSQVAPAGFESAQLVQHARIQILEYTGALRAQQFKSVLSAEDMALLRVWTGRVKHVYAILEGMPKLQAALSDKRSWSDCCRRGTRLSELCRWSAARMLAAPPGASSPPALLSSLRLRLSGRARFQDARMCDAPSMLWLAQCRAADTVNSHV